MKKLLFSILATLPTLLLGQTTMTNLSAEQASGLSGDHYRRAIQDYAAQIEANWQAGRLESGGYHMPFAYSISGDMPETGYPLYISLHGGGSATADENDAQWENQKILYGAVEGVYFVPRAPTNTWDMWHRGYMDDLLLQVVTYAVARLDVDPSRVYLLGYSAGGDGVYNLAARLSDRFAAAAMMAGHPGDARIENLRNLPFAIYVGAEDTAYDRSLRAFEWAQAYAVLNGEDQDGFSYHINIYEGLGHWMNGLDGEAIGWLAEHRRASSPDRVIWIQDDVLIARKHNLEVDNPKQGFRIEEIVDYDNNTIYLYSDDYDSVTVWLDDFLVDLDRPVAIVFNGREVFNEMVARTEQNIIDSIEGCLDPEYVYWGRVRARR